MNKEKFLSEIYLIFEDRGIKEKPSKAWLKKLYEGIEYMSELEFARGLKRIHDISQEEWHNKYGFGGKPAISDWVAFFGSKKQSPEKQAIIEVVRILDYAKYYLGNDVIFDNEFTNGAVKKYGGISKIAWDIDKENDNKRQLEWIKKDLIELWVACYDGNHGSFEKCLGRQQPEFFSNGKFIRQENALDFIGSKDKCLLLMNKKEEKPLNLAIQQKTSRIVSDIAKSFKSI
jgi:hypothetical protein